MSFLTDDRSVEQSQPREGIEIILPSETIRLATGTRDITIDGERYTAMPSARTAAKVIQPGSTEEMQVVLPAADPFVRRYMTATPRNVLVNIWRHQITSGEAEIIWRGHIAGISISSEGHATFTVPGTQRSPLGRTLPMFTAERSCAHVLYGPHCGVDQNAHKVTTAITLVNGRVVTVASMGVHADNWAQFGKLVHVSSGESMTVTEQIGTTLTMRSPIGGMKTGDAVEVYAGCSLLVLTCRDKFDNVPRFGGFAVMPKTNPFRGAGLALT